MKQQAQRESIIDLVARRDGFRCIAPATDGRSGWCRDKWGNVITRWPTGRLDRDKITVAHVKDADAQSMGMKAPFNALHLVLLCWGHHEGTGNQGGYCWGTSKVGLDHQRRYLAQFAPRPKELLL